MDRMLVKSTLAGIVSLSLLAGCGQPSLEQQIQNAEDAYKSENYHEAALTLRNAVQEAPNDANARVLLALKTFMPGKSRMIGLTCARSATSPQAATKQKAMAASLRRFKRRNVINACPMPVSVRP